MKTFHIDSSWSAAWKYAAWIVTGVLVVLLLTGDVRCSFPAAKADDGWSVHRQDRWHATHNAALTGCITRSVSIDDEWCRGMAQKMADRTHGRLPR